MHRNTRLITGLAGLLTLSMAVSATIAADRPKEKQADNGDTLTVQLRDPIATMEKEHAITQKIVGIAADEAKAIQAGQALDTERLKKLHDFFLNFADRCHHQKEERYLFPLLKKHGVAEDAIDAAVDHHERGRELLQTLDELLDRDEFTESKRETLVETLQNYVGLMQGHIQLEDAGIWQHARQALSDTEKKRLAMAFRVIETLELGEGFHEKYHALAKSLLGKKGASARLSPDTLGETERVHRYNGFLLASQPAPEAFPKTADRGIATVINLRYSDETDFDEKAVVTDLGMSYEQVSFNSPEDLTTDKLDRIRGLLKQSDKPVLLHCSSANRVGAVWLAYRTFDTDADFDTALDEAKTVGLRTPGFIDVVRAYVGEQ